MSKALEALERLKMFPIYQEIKRTPQQFRDKESINNDLSLIEKSLKALEIIKDKQVDVLWLTDLDDKSLDGYNEMMLDSMGAKKYRELTQEEYDLLMEVLL